MTDRRLSPSSPGSPGSAPATGPQPTQRLRQASRTPSTMCVLIIDAHRMFGTALRAALRGHGMDAHVVPVDDPDMMLATVGRYATGVVVLELDLGRDGSGRRIRTTELVVTLTRQGRKVLVVRGGRDDDAAAAAVAAGASGVLSKSVSLSTLVHALVRLSAGLTIMSDADRREWLARHRGHQDRERRTTERLRRLSRRELEVLRLLAAGHRVAAIAEQSGVATATVRRQVSSVLSKLEVGSQLEAVAFLFGSRTHRTDPNRD